MPCRRSGRRATGHRNEQASMTVLPVIARELRASARQPFTYYLRVLGVTALLLASLLFGLHYGFEPALGRRLFGALHGTLFGAIWLLVPMLTADCISRERREGTLGLLFLTPLTGTDVVVAKGLVHGLRALTLSLAVVPVLTVPFLIFLCAGTGWFLLHTVSAGQLRQFDISWDRSMVAGLFILANVSYDWSSYFPWGSTGKMFSALGHTTLVSLLMLVVAVLVAGAKTRRSWQEEPPSRRQVWLQRTFCTPVIWVTFFRRWMRWKLERNPIGWLEQRTWSGRLVTWGWFAVLISIYSAVLTDRHFFQDANPLQEIMAWLLAGSMAMSAAASFQRERETGVLELLLVSPLGENQILSGRLRGLWGQFLPAVVLLLAVWSY